MAYPAICPICKGTGKIIVGRICRLKGMPFTPSPSLSDDTEICCYGCNGKGWVEVSDASDKPLSYSTWSGSSKIAEKGVPNENKRSNGI